MLLPSARRAWRGLPLPLLVALAGLTGALALPAGVAAHASLVASTPADGEVLGEVLGEAVLTFDEPLTGGTFEVFDAGGARMTAGGVDPADARSMRAVLPALAPGVYEVRWTALTDDGGVERGTISFTVAEPTPPPVTTPVPTAEPSGVPGRTAGASPSSTASSVPTDAGDGASGASEADVFLPIVAVALLVGVGLSLILRRGNRG